MQLVEVEYFLFLSEKKFFKLPSTVKDHLLKTVADFSVADAEQIKDTEKITNHDVKAVEYYIKKELDALKLSHLKEWVHFGLTSQDINNTAIPMLWKDALEHDVAAPVDLEATHSSALEFVSLEQLQAHALKK